MPSSRWPWMSLADPRRNVPRTDAVLADPRLQDATQRLGRPAVKRAVSAVLEQVRAGTLPPDAAADVAVACLPELPATITPVINATGVVRCTRTWDAPPCPMWRWLPFGPRPAMSTWSTTLRPGSVPSVAAARWPRCVIPFPVPRTC